MGSNSFYAKDVVVLLTFSSLAITAVLLRIWSRKLTKLGYDWNDYLVVFGLVFALGEACFAVYGCFFELARDSNQNLKNEVSEAAVTLANKSIFIDPLIWVIAVTCVRSSVISLYVRIFPARPFRNACYVALACNIVFAVATVLTDCLICKPIAYRWDRSLRGHCGTQKSFALFVGIVNLLLDVVTVILPMPILWRLQMALKRKVILSGMFGMGFGICALTLYRLYATVSIDPSNWQEGYTRIILLTCLEALLGVINSCLPTLKPAVDKVRAVFSEKGYGTVATFIPRNVRHTLRAGSDRHRAQKSYTSIGEEPSAISMSASWVKSSNRNLVEMGQANIDCNEEVVADRGAAIMSPGKMPDVHMRSDMF